jgi:hypothetical protein
MNPAAIRTTLEKLKALDMEPFERDAWQADVAKLEQRLWRCKTPDAETSIDLITVLDACGVKTCLKAFGATDVAGHRMARLIAVDLVWRAVIPLHQTEVGTLCEKSLNQISGVLETGGAIGVLSNLGASLKLYGGTRGENYASSAESGVLDAVGSIIFPYDGPPDAPEEFDLIGHLCAETVLDCVMTAPVHMDARYVAAAHLADLGVAAERRWQQGTDLKFQFCINEISQAMCDLENSLLKEFEQGVLEKASVIVARRLGRRL